jgi:predicted HTH transcriptional regulator
VDLALFEGEELDPDHQVDRKPIRGPILRQIEQVTDYLKLHVVTTAARKTGRGRTDHPAYSLRGLQEAVVNAVVHRDYSILGSQVRVYAFDDRVEITNPGRLHNTLTPENLFAGCHPVRRNQMLAAFLFESENPVTGKRYMEMSGAGFRLLLRECSLIGAPMPRLEIVGDSVKLTVYRVPQA